MLSASLLAMLGPLLAQAVPASAAQEDTTPTGAAVAAATDEARAMWERLLAAYEVRREGDATPPAREPIRAFEIRADVLTRQGVQTNEARIDYRYLAPDAIRFMLPSRQETGRFGPAPEQYWLKSGDDVVVLAGREYKEDRRAVDDMVALARNYVALSDPKRLRIHALERMAAPPADLGPELASRTKKLRWLALESPDFALVRNDAPRPAGTVYRVEIGQREDGLPGVAIVRERAPEGVRAAGEPLLVEFSRYEERDGYRIPLTLLVHVLDHAQSPPVFAQRASQEVYVTAASLRPGLTVEDFKPARKK